MKEDCGSERRAATLYGIPTAPGLVRRRGSDTINQKPATHLPFVRVAYR